MRGPWKRRNERWWLSTLTPENRAAYDALTPEQQANYWRVVREELKQ